MVCSSLKKLAPVVPVHTVFDALPHPIGGAVGAPQNHLVDQGALVAGKLAQDEIRNVPSFRGWANADSQAGKFVRPQPLNDIGQALLSAGGAFGSKTEFSDRQVEVVANNQQI